MRYKESYLKAKVEQINKISKARYAINWDYGRPELICKNPNSTGVSQISYRVSRTEMGMMLDCLDKYLSNEKAGFNDIKNCAHVSDMLSGSESGKTLIFNGVCISCNQEAEEGKCPKCNADNFGLQTIIRGDPTLTNDKFTLVICRNCNYQPFTDIRGLV